MRREIRLIVALFLLVVGPAAVLCFLAGRILGNWHLILERRLESSAALMLDSTAFAADARINESLNGLVRPGFGLARPPGRGTDDGAVRGGFSASNLWTQGIFVFSPDGAFCIREVRERGQSLRTIGRRDGRRRAPDGRGGRNDADPEDLPARRPARPPEPICRSRSGSLSPFWPTRPRSLGGLPDKVASGARLSRGRPCQGCHPTPGAAPSLAQAIDSEETREGDEAPSRSGDP